jgi:hypothetical protein
VIQALKPIETIDYLVLGHITQDITTNGYIPGGTACYAALTARAFGLKVGILTSYADDAILPELHDIQIIRQPSDFSTVFENIYHKNFREQIIHSQAEILHPRYLPESWATAPFVHFGPIAHEIDLDFFKFFPNAFIGVTPQGWYRDWESTGRVIFRDWMESSHYLSKANAVVLSIEDVKGNEDIIAALAYTVRVLVVTDGYSGARVYWNGDVRNFRPPTVEEIEPTGAGDIFATAFFIRLKQTQNPWEAARFATLIAAKSVTRRGLESVPTESEILRNLSDVVDKK